MTVTVGTFNLNNLFSRFNFAATVDSVPEVLDGGLLIGFQSGEYRVRTFKGRLVEQKDPRDTRRLAKRILRTRIDVLAVQEVEHIGMLHSFNRKLLSGLYPHLALIEGNDQRLLDVGILSMLPIGPVTTHQTAVHKDDPRERVFSRDLLQAEIRDHRGDKLFNVYNTHLKSHYVPYDEDPVEGAKQANCRRKRQAETISRILSETENAGTGFVLLGDMNDPPDSEHLAPMVEFRGTSLTNGLANAQESRKPKAERPGQEPKISNWTHRYKESGHPPRHEQLDQVWLSPAFSQALSSAHIDRRTRHGGDGSDHDPAWVVLDL